MKIVNCLCVGSLHDIVSRVPPDRIGRSEVFLMTLVEGLDAIHE